MDGTAENTSKSLGPPASMRAVSVSIVGLMHAMLICLAGLSSEEELDVDLRSTAGRFNSVLFRRERTYLFYC